MHYQDHSDFLQKIEKHFYNLCGTMKDPQQSRNPEKRRIKKEGITPSDFRLYYKAIVIKTVRIGIKQTSGPKEQKGERSQIKLSIRGQLVLDKGAKSTQWRKDSFFKKWCWDNWIFTCIRMKLDQIVHHSQN